LCDELGWFWVAALKIYYILHSCNVWNLTLPSKSILFLCTLHAVYGLHSDLENGMDDINSVLGEVAHIK